MRVETLALYLAARHPQTPWYAKALAAFIVGYALSPIDLVPDFIPVVGYLDDLVLVPLGIVVAWRLVPADVRVECKARASAEAGPGLRRSWKAGAVVMAIWLGIAAMTALLLWRVLF